MRTAVSEKILKILDDLERQRNVPLTRLTVLKKWFECPRRLSAFGLWIARQAADGACGTTGEAGSLLDQASALLGAASTQENIFQQIDPESAGLLHEQACDFHKEYVKQQWALVRIIHCWPLLLVEEGLALHLGRATSPRDGYKLAADWARNYDPPYDHGLSAASRGKLHELVQFISIVEALEEE